MNILSAYLLAALEVSICQFGLEVSAEYWKNWNSKPLGEQNRNKIHHSDLLSTLSRRTIPTNKNDMSQLQNPMQSVEKTLNLSAEAAKPSGDDNKMASIQPFISTPEPSIAFNLPLTSRSTLKKGNSHLDKTDSGSDSSATGSKASETIAAQDQLDVAEHSTLPTSTINSADRKATDCPTCAKNGITEDIVKDVRLNMFNDLLAKKMRVNFDVHPMEGYQSDRPVGGKMPILPPWIMEEATRGDSEETEKEQFYARDKEVIIPGTNIGQECLKGAYSCFSFSLSDKIKQEVAKAELWFYKVNVTKSKYELNFKVQELKKTASGNLTKIYLQVKRLQTGKDGWVGLNMTRAVRKWVSVKTDDLMLAVLCNNCKFTNHGALLEDEEYKPLLVVTYVDRAQVVRKKRSENCNPSTECCKRDLSVVFHDMALYEVLQPREMNIGYCYGDCNTLRQYQNNHTSLRARHYSHLSQAAQTAIGNQIRSCCVPTRLKSFRFVVTDNNNIVTRDIPNIMVDTCGCL